MSVLKLNFNCQCTFISSCFRLVFWLKMDNSEKISHAIYLLLYTKKNDSQTHTQELGPPCRNFQICKNSLLLLKKNSSKIWFRARLLNFNIFREAISCEIRTRINLLNFTLVVKKWRVKSFFPSLSPFTTFTSSRVIHFSNALIVRYFDLELWTMHFKTRRRSLDSNSK